MTFLSRSIFESTVLAEYAHTIADYGFTMKVGSLASSLMMQFRGTGTLTQASTVTELML